MHAALRAKCLFLFFLMSENRLLVHWSNSNFVERWTHGVYNFQSSEKFLMIAFTIKTQATKKLSTTGITCNGSNLCSVFVSKGSNCLVEYPIRLQWYSCVVFSPFITLNKCKHTLYQIVANLFFYPLIFITITISLVLMVEWLFQIRKLW